MKFSDEVAKFRAWALVRLSPNWIATDFAHADAEWECDYPDWSAIYAAVAVILKRGEVPCEAELRDLVYVLARDNEDEQVLEMLASRPDVTSALCGFSAEEPEARWQLAVALGKIGSSDAKIRLSSLQSDSDEYVRRRAKFALQESEA